MLISFFEEYPSKKNLEKLNRLEWKPRLFLAAENYTAFQEISRSIPKSKVLETVYWPVFQKKEGYWVSPFAKDDALRRLFIEAKDVASHAPLMIDAELPTTQNPSLYLTEAAKFFSHRRLIRKLMMERKSHTYSCEYYPEGAFWDWILKVLGVSFPPPEFRVSVIKMLYHSMHHFDEGFIREEISKGVAAYGDRYLIGLGTIAKGIHGTEPRLGLTQLKKDLSIAREGGVKEVVIYRLGGLDERYIRALRYFI